VSGVAEVWCFVGAEECLTNQLIINYYYFKNAYNSKCVVIERTTSSSFSD